MTRPPSVSSWRVSFLLALAACTDDSVSGPESLSVTTPGAPELHVDAEGASAVADNGSMLRVTMDALGRDGLGTPALHAPPRVVSVNQAGEAIRFSADRGQGATEWWIPLHRGFEQGFDLTNPPEGEGPVRLELSASDADVTATGDRLRIDTDDDGVWSVSAVSARDADNTPLPAWFETTPSGFDIVVDDTDAVYPLGIDPVYTTGFTSLTATYASTVYPAGLASGDVNNDGYADVAIGEPTYSSHTGRVRVYYGSASGLDTTTYTTVTASSTYSLMGYSVAFGDVNGDGYDDLIAGAPMDDAVYVYHGSATGLSTTAAAYLTSTATSVSYGFVVASGEDTNGDGYDDVAVSAPGASASSGAVYVYRGSSTGVSSTVTRTYTGSTGYQLAYHMAMGNVNNDGYGDLMTVPGAYGYVYVYHGSSSGTGASVSTTLTLGSGIYAINSQGDANADGYDDVVVGISGAIGVFHGSSTGVSTTAARTISGTSADYFGRSAAFAGDVDGDGDSDVMVGASRASATDAGAAYLYLGSTSGVASTVTTTISGTAATGYLATQISTAGDVDGDGFDEVMLWASGEDMVYVYAGYQDLDGDGYDTVDDCDDTDSATHPGATELVGDDIDENCDGFEKCYYDADDDGYRTSSSFTATDADCDDSGEALSADASNDCHDSDATAHPGATEIAGDAYDQDCDTDELCYVDADNDGNRLSTTVTSSDTDCADSGEALAAETAGDCDDMDATAYVGATEIDADGVDADCNGTETCYADADGDGYRGSTLAISVDADCSDGSEVESTYTSGDCDDAHASAYPGGTEVTGDEVDGDCDGDELCYVDADGDGYGSFAIVLSTDTDCADAGEATNADDCDDGDATANPGEAEAIGDGVDEDCDGHEVCYVNADGDAYRLADTVVSTDDDCSDSGEALSGVLTEDCDDGNAAVNPGEAEIVGDGVDEDCDGGELCYEDTDADGYRTSSTLASGDADCADVGEAVNTAPDSDCDDTNAAANPGATELIGDDVDEDCNGLELCYEDSDADGYRTDVTVYSLDADCSDATEALATLPSVDCNDADATVNPGTVETPSDDVDEDCDGFEACFHDDDGDGYRTDEAVASTDADCDDAGEALSTVPGGDCNDYDVARSPGVVEVPASGIDEDCDGLELCYSDADADGYRTDSTVSSFDLDCTGPSEAGAALPGGDCDDAEAAVNPGVTETAGDELDSDCDGTELCYADADADGFRSDGEVVSENSSCADTGEAPETGVPGDCDDGDPVIYPGADESVGDEVDSDCDGTEVCYVDADGDGLRTDETVASSDVACDAAGEATVDESMDCDDTDEAIHETCPSADGDTAAGAGKDGGCGCDASTGAGPVALLPAALALLALRRRNSLVTRKP